MWLRLASQNPKIKYCSSHLVRYMLDSLGGATVKRRSQDSLIKFWQAMDALFEQSKENVSHDLLQKCINQFANKSYRFYVRSGYYLVANYLYTLACYQPCKMDRLLHLLPHALEKAILNFIYQIRQKLL